MKQITQQHIFTALLKNSRYTNRKPETQIVNTKAKVGLNPAIGNAIRNNHDPFTDRDRIIVAYQAFTAPAQILNSENQELDLAGGQILGNGGSFKLAQALRSADENCIQSELLKVEDLELRSRLTTIVQVVGRIQGSRR